MQKSNLILGAFALVFSQFSAAQEAQQPTQKKAKQTHALYLSLGQVNFDAEVALQEGVEDNATYIRFAWQGQRDRIVYGAGISGYAYSDEEGFRQGVEDNFGNRSTASSSADAVNLFFEGGYSQDIAQNLSLDILGGYELVMQSERGISNCSDCRSSDIDVGAGLYATPRIKFTADNGLILAATYHHYLSGDVENAYSLTFGWVF